MQIRVLGGAARIRTRKGLDWTDRLPSLAAAAAKLPDCILDGELCALDDKGVPRFADLQSSTSRKTSERLVFFAFDLLFLEGRDLRSLGLLERKAMLQDLLPEPGILRFVDHLTGDGATILKHACSLGLEGIVSKRVDARYVSRRTPAWQKVKCFKTSHAVVGGWWGTRTQIRALLIGIHQGKTFRYIGRVGSGLPASLTRWLLPRLLASELETSAFTPAPGTKGRSYHWTKPILIAEISFLEWTASGQVRHASLKGVSERDAIEQISWLQPPAE